MAKIYKHRNPLIKKLALLLSACIICGVIPVGMLVVFVFNIGDENVRAQLWIAAAFAVVLALFVVLSQRYNILLSGYRGERRMLKIARKIKGKEICFMNLPISHGTRHSEIDMLVLWEGGLLIIEVKNHSGIIEGDEKDNHWLQEKVYRKNGRAGVNTKFIDNPFRQIKRQREILKAVLNEAGLNILIDCAIFFSNPAATLKIRHEKTSFIADSEEGIINLIKTRKTKSVINKKDYSKIIELLKP